MLSKVLSKKSCANCRFCCSFRRVSLWETPIFTEETIKKLSHENEYGVIGKFKDNRMDLENDYTTDDSEEEVKCQFLDPKKGCILNSDDKPFDCSIWPLRLMKKDDTFVVAFTPTCAALGKTPSEDLVNLVKNEGLGQLIFDYGKNHPEIIKDYHEGFPIIMTY